MTAKVFELLQNFLKRIFYRKHNLSREIGIKSEAIAARYLKAKGIKILKRNWRYGRYEIDIVGLSPGKMLVFFEVKARSSQAMQSGYYAVDRKKKQTTRIAVKEYLKGLPDSHPVFRFDVLEIEWSSDKTYVCRHFENIPLFPKHFY